MKKLVSVLSVVSVLGFANIILANPEEDIQETTADMEKNGMLALIFWFIF